ncbi:YihY/virulence factor BrkB family protein [Zunongwangia endophytica]|uniref:YihY/virulence factor BrkB family protein n=1 Tax=Zunongwangia endophytica TaxID=1808945 RepID=A0ABV8H4F0_9FLAO|nr:YihY/virulence factor BrkB family protein [Zunongwangia endophytica]MDN3595500.1 YihY/virulence factor BrkB family protein [Zunongwangia endophytica]
MEREAIDTKKEHNPFKLKLKGWWEVLKQIYSEIGEDKVSIVSAGVAFYAFLAVFPAIMALISIYGLATDPQDIERQISELSAMMPKQAFEILQQRIDVFLESHGDKLGWGTLFGILFSIWSANKGTNGLLTGVDIAYDTEQDHNIFKQYLMASIFTVGGLAMLILSMVLIVGFPALVHKIGLPEHLENIISWSRWLILAVLVCIFLCMVYKFAPARKQPALRWVIPGAIFSTLVWLAASYGFSFYVSNFGNYGEVYGSISAVVVLLMWLYITCFIILLGAEINTEIVDHLINVELEAKKEK